MLYNLEVALSVLKSDNSAEGTNRNRDHVVVTCRFNRPWVSTLVRLSYEPYVKEFRDLMLLAAATIN